MHQRWHNVSLRKVGGIWFLTMGRIHLMFCVSRTFREPQREAVQLQLL